MIIICLFVQYHIFTLMVYDVYWNSISITWVIIDSAKANDIALWLSTMRQKMVSIRP
jgi:hypothetical protein